jgi:3-phenylpropionate/trans-cinnamate dioxygenase ferredoxin reductase subunit
MEYTGDARPTDRVVFRGEPASGSFIAFWLADERPVAAAKVSADVPMKVLTALVTARPRVAVERLADAAVPLDDLGALAGAAGIAA